MLISISVFIMLLPPFYNNMVCKRISKYAVIKEKYFRRVTDLLTIQLNKLATLWQQKISKPK